MMYALIIPRLSPMWPAIIPPSWLWPLFGRNTITSIGASILVVYILAISLIASVALNLSRSLLSSKAARPKPHSGSRWLGRIVGSLLLLVGVLLLLLPAPSLVAKLCGMVFGGSLFFRISLRLRALEQRLLRHKSLLSLINRLRSLVSAAKIRPLP